MDGTNRNFPIGVPGLSPRHFALRSHSLAAGARALTDAAFSLDDGYRGPERQFRDKFLDDLVGETYASAGDLFADGRGIVRAVDTDDRRAARKAFQAVWDRWRLTIYL